MMVIYEGECDGSNRGNEDGDEGNGDDNLMMEMITLIVIKGNNNDLCTTVKTALNNDSMHFSYCIYIIIDFSNKSSIMGKNNNEIFFRSFIMHTQSC